MINIVDAIMGAGKTSAMIQHINDSDPDEKYIFITPYLTEVERIIDCCAIKDFRQPETFGSKLNGFKYLLEQNENIASTHRLFGLLDKETFQTIKAKNYILVLDEVIDIVEPQPISSHDLETILEKYATINEKGLLQWHAHDYVGQFQEYKRLAELDCIGIYGDKNVLLKLFPVDAFTSFRTVYILTYLFEAQSQCYYFKFHRLPYQYLYVSSSSGKFLLQHTPIKPTLPDYRQLIRICEKESLNRIGDAQNALSKTWYERNAHSPLLHELKCNCINYFKNITKTKSGDNIWTTYKDFKDKISAKGYKKAFISSNLRATNAYRSRTAVAYLVNRYFNPFVKNFFLANGIEVNEDLYAVSEMLQCIWRSAIRDGKEIQIYIPSSRMRRLLQEWIASLESERIDTVHSIENGEIIGR